MPLVTYGGDAAARVDKHERNCLVGAAGRGHGSALDLPLVWWLLIKSRGG